MAEQAQQAAVDEVKSDQWRLAVIDAATENGWMVDGAPANPYPKKGTTQYEATLKCFKRRMIDLEPDINKKMWSLACFELSQGAVTSCAKTSPLYSKVKTRFDQLKKERQARVQEVMGDALEGENQATRQAESFDESFLEPRPAKTRKNYTYPEPASAGPVRAQTPASARRATYKTAAAASAAPTSLSRKNTAASSPHGRLSLGGMPTLPLTSLHRTVSVDGEQPSSYD